MNSISVPAHKIADEVIEVIAAKGADYAGKENPWRSFESAELVGVDPGRAILVRLLDKVSRASNLLGSDPRVAEESLADTAKDLVGYALIFAVWVLTRRGRG